jgi:hypothetical protein
MQPGHDKFTPTPCLGTDVEWMSLLKDTEILVRPEELLAQVQGFKCSAHGEDGVPTCVHQCAEKVAKAIEERVVLRRENVKID